MTTLTIRLPEQLRSDLKKLSREEHKAVSDIVRDSLRRHVAVQQFRSLRRKILPFAEKTIHPGLDFVPQRFRCIVFFNLKNPVQEIDEWKVRHVLRIGVGMSFHPLYLLKIERRFKVLDQSALSGAGIAAY